MIKRFPAILRLILFILSAVVWIVSLSVPLSLPVRIAVTLLCLGSLIFCAASRRCPYCRRFGLDSRPFAKNSGYCNRCGKLAEYPQNPQRRSLSEAIPKEDSI